jgi:GNAT superfamily N-acetyltransferase
MNIELRPVTSADAEECGRIIYEAFKSIAERHNFRPDFPAMEMGMQLAHAFIENPSIFGVVAESDGEIVGSNFLTEWDAIRAVGPITVDPKFQGHGVGRRLMLAIIERGRNAVGVRLVQDAFNTTSLSLYASLGFDVKEPLALVEGRIQGEVPAGVEVRPMEDEDLKACGELCRRVHGFERMNELKDTPPMFTPIVARREGRIVAYSSAPTFWPFNQGVAETEDDMQALLAGAGAMSDEPFSFLLPTRQAGLFRWCLEKGMRVAKPLTLMAMGEYREPRGCYLPSVGY